MVINITVSDPRSLSTSYPHVQLQSLIMTLTPCKKVEGGVPVPRRGEASVAASRVPVLKWRYIASLRHKARRGL